MAQNLLKAIILHTLGACKGFTWDSNYLQFYGFYLLIKG